MMTTLWFAAVCVALIRAYGPWWGFGAFLAGAVCWAIDRAWEIYWKARRP